MTKAFVIEGSNEASETHGVEGVFMNMDSAVEAAMSILINNKALDFVRVVTVPVGGGASEAVIFWGRRVCPPINKGWVSREEREITFTDKRGSIREEN